MVFVCFVGIKKESLRVGRAVLPKFFLGDVGREGFDVVMRYGRKVGVSDLPKVMVDVFLRDYLGVETVVGRDLKAVCGYFMGLMEEKKTGSVVFNEIFEEEKMGSHIIGIGCFSKDIYMLSEAEKKNWKILPRKRYPKPLIFHDGRLAFRPTPLAALAMFIWIPFGLFLLIIRFIVGLFLPYKMSIPILSFTGMKILLSRPNSFINQTDNETKPRGKPYVCNHRTLLDPIYVSMAVMKPLTAVTYSISRFTELFSPIKTIRLTREREKDKKMMEKLLSQGDLVVCPEGTTCREPYLLRFSPLFAEMSDEIVPVAIDVQASMFYGTTASGVKCLDPVFVLMNHYVTYSVKILEKLPRSFTCGVGGKSKFEVANHTQTQIAKALGFECTSFTWKNKYLILAGNEGTI
ncbi:hypothetical protein L1049_021130 [Liquidambar formosana]|uniref:Phospholipid/glycerol acyltransferase domain-containing protein n=1 Tax=Liquidambar formosana TaxID=63359 RepID=A0AAP0SCE6_LIQFO